MMNTIFKISLGSSNSYLIKGDDGFLLIDTGTTNKSDKVENILEESRAEFSDIDLIIITHVHYDHVGSLAEIKQKSGAQVLVHKNGKDLLARGITDFPRGTNFFSKIISFLGNKLFASKGKFEPVEPYIVIAADYDLSSFGVKGKIVHTPGHTMDSVCVILEDGSCFTGDTMFNLSPTSVFPIFANDTEDLIKSWKKLKKFDCETFYPGHGNEFSREKFENTLQKYED